MPGLSILTMPQYPQARGPKAAGSPKVPIFLP